MLALPAEARLSQYPRPKAGPRTSQKMFDRNQPLWLYQRGLFFGVGGILQRDQIMPLTSLRFFAAGAIVIFHMSGQGLMPFGPAPALANGVSLFFVLSGFILTYNYQDMRDGIGRFYLARFARLWPVHFATLMLLMFMLPQTGNWATQPSGFPIFLANFTLFQSWVPNGAYTLSFNGVSWSISVEMFFYAVFPLALLVKRLWLLALAALIGTLSVVSYAHLHGYTVGGDPWGYTWQHVILHLPPMRLFEFLTGMAAARLFLANGKFQHTSTGLEAVAILYALASVAFAQYFASQGAYGAWIAQCGSFMAFAALIYVLAAGNGAVADALCNPILVRLGEISFATYMIHQIVIRHAVNSKMLNMWAKPATAIVIIIAAYLASYVLWKMVEVPSRRWLLSLGQSRVAPAE